MAEQLRPDLVLMDLSLPVLSGVAATKRIRSLSPHHQGRGAVDAVGRDGRVLGPRRRGSGLSGEGQHHGRDRRRSAGGHGGGAWRALVLSPSAAPVTPQSDGVAQMTRQPSGSRPLISKREEEVLRLVATGASIPEVGRRLYISAKTVKNHLSSIYQKLDSHDRAQAVLKAVRMGLIQID